MGTFFDWQSNPKAERFLKSLYNEFGSNYEIIADKMEDKFKGNFSKSSVRSKIRRSEIIDYIPNKRAKGLFKGFSGELEEEYFKYPEIRDKILKIMRKFKKKYSNKEIKVLDISDLHSPYTNYDYLESAIINNQDAEVLLVKGDSVSYEVYSSFGNKKNISLIEEHRKLYDIFEILSDIFPWIIVFDGNHERRARRNIKRKVVKGLNGIIDNRKPLTDVTRFFDNIDYIPHYLVQIGDLVSAHPDHYSKIPMRTVSNELDNLLGNEHQKEFDDFSVVSIGHTHKLGKIFRKGYLVLETGCMCHDLDYKKERNTSEKWQPGYVVHHMKNCKVVKNKTKIVYLD